MTPLVFALVDAALWAQWQPSFQRERHRRATARRQRDRRMMQVWHNSMALARTLAVGWWRSLWGAL